LSDLFGLRLLARERRIDDADVGPENDAVELVANFLERDRRRLVTNLGRTLVDVAEARQVRRQRVLLGAQQRARTRQTLFDDLIEPRSERLILLRQIVDALHRSVEARIRRRLRRIAGRRQDRALFLEGFRVLLTKQIFARAA